MPIHLLKLKNFASIREAEYQFGKFNIITGKNGQGKSSVLNAIKYLFNGGDEAEIVRHGENEGEVVVVLDDGSKARRRIAPSSTSEKLSLKDSEGNDVKKPATAVKSKFDAYSLDPLKFLQAKNEEQTSLFLQAIPLTVTKEVLKQRTGRDFIINEQQHALVVLDNCYKSLYEERTTVNRSVKEKKLHIEQLQATLPTSYTELNHDARINELETKKSEIENKRLQRKEQYMKEAQEALDTAEAEYQKQLEELQKRRSDTRISITDAREAKIAEMMQKSSAQYDPIVDELKTLKSNQENAIVWSATKQNIEHNKKVLDEELNEQKSLNEALTGIEKIREELMQALPFDGVTIVDGTIHVNGTSINQLSTAESMRFAVQVATQRLGEINAVLVDNGECFDSDSFEQLILTCEESGVQLFVTMVTDDENVTVETFADAENAVGKRKFLSGF